MLPGLDPFNLIDAAQSLQTSAAQAANAVIMLGIKAILLLFLYQAINAVLPRAYRPLWGLSALALVVLRPDLANAIGDAALSILAKSNLLPQISLPSISVLAGL